MNDKSLRLLIVEDSRDDAELTVLALEQDGYEVDYRRVDTADAMKRALTDGTPWDGVLSDFRMPRFNGLDAFRTLESTGQDLPFIIVSGAIGEERAAEIMRAGAHDCVRKDNLARLGPAIEREVREAKRRHQQRLTEARLRQTQKLEALGQLAGGVAHDFNNLLTSIVGFTNLALEELADDNPGRQDLFEVLSAAEKATELTRQLMLFSRDHPTELQVVDLGAALKNSERLLQRTIGEDIAFTLSIPDQPLNVLAEPTQLDQIILNLAVNARDAMPKGGTLRIEAQTIDAEQQYARIAVIDSGVGMDESTQARIFEPFFTTKSLHEGTGLGLAICYSAIKQLEGNIEVQSEVGQGTQFTVDLPLLTEDMDYAEAHDPQPATLGGDETILVIEDEPAIRRVVRRTLQQYGYTVLTAKDGVDGMESFERHQDNIDLVFCDVVLPRGNGFDVARSVQQQRPETGILLTSGYTDRQSEEPLPEFPILWKPYNPAELAQRIRTVLDQRPKLRPAHPQERAESRS